MNDQEEQKNEGNTSTTQKPLQEWQETPSTLSILQIETALLNVKTRRAKTIAMTAAALTVPASDDHLQNPDVGNTDDQVLNQ